jgi:hypothetical protein
MTTPVSLFVNGPNLRRFPTVVMKVGYTESYEDLESDAQLFFEGSAGQIGTVILVKIQPLLLPEKEIKSAFLQVYHYDTEHGEAVPKGGREVSLFITTLYPLLANIF